LISSIPSEYKKMEIIDLIVKCLSDDPKSRPTVSELLKNAPIIENKKESKRRLSVDSFNENFSEDEESFGKSEFKDFRTESNKIMDMPSKSKKKASKGGGGGLFARKKSREMEESVDMVYESKSNYMEQSLSISSMEPEIIESKSVGDSYFLPTSQSSKPSSGKSSTTIVPKRMEKLMKKDSTVSSVPPPPPQPTLSSTLGGPPSLGRIVSAPPSAPPKIKMERKNDLFSEKEESIQGDDNEEESILPRQYEEEIFSREYEESKTEIMLLDSIMQSKDLQIIQPLERDISQKFDSQSTKTRQLEIKKLLDIINNDNVKMKDFAISGILDFVEKDVFSSIKYDSDSSVRSSVENWSEIVTGLKGHYSKSMSAATKAQYDQLVATLKQMSEAENISDIARIMSNSTKITYADEELNMQYKDSKSYPKKKGGGFSLSCDCFSPKEKSAAELLAEDLSMSIIH
jgi:hypothetical protein